MSGRLKISIAIAGLAFLLVIHGCDAGDRVESHITAEASVAKAAGPIHEHSADEVASDIYRCPMHPQITSDRPGSCPICGMDLVKVEPEKPQGTASTDQGVHEEAGKTPETPHGLSMVSLEAQQRDLIGVSSVPAEEETLEKTIRAAAILKPDERRIEQAQSKIQGWIEHLYVNFTGQYVKRGQALLAIYSPDLVSTQEEYLLAVRNLESLSDADDETRKFAGKLVDAARRRLRYWDISNAQIEKLARTGSPFKKLTIYSPARGYVLHTNAVEGMEVKPGMPLYTIADLSRVWVIAQVKENDIGLVRKGMAATFIPDAFPEREFEGKVTYIDPVINPATRTAGVRIDLPNSDLELKIDMSGVATLHKDLGMRLTVPLNAVMDNGDSKVVYVEVDTGHYMPREVKTGVTAGERIEIVEGLEKGEKVVEKGNFLLDSESRLRASLPGAGGGHNH